jgi:hypothetical protein
VLAPVAVGDGAPRHDPQALAAALQPLLRFDTDGAAGKIRARGAGGVVKIENGTRSRAGNGGRARAGTDDDMTLNTKTAR